MKPRSLFVVVLTLIAALTVGLAVMQAQAVSPLVWLGSDAEQVVAGQEIVVTVHVDEAIGVYGGSFKLTFDPQAFEVVPQSEKIVTPGTFFADQPGFTLKNSADSQTGVIEYALTLTQPAEPISGSGDIGVVHFRALRDGAVEMQPQEARLLAPEFTEVNGRKIARQINEIETRVQGITVTGGDAQPMLNFAQAPLATIAAPTVSTPPLLVTTDNRPMMLVVGGLLLLGMGTLLATVSAYAGLRREYKVYRKRLEQI